MYRGVIFIVLQIQGFALRSHTNPNLWIQSILDSRIRKSESLWIRVFANPGFDYWVRHSQKRNFCESRIRENANPGCDGFVVLRVCLIGDSFHCDSNNFVSEFAQTANPANVDSHGFARFAGLRITEATDSRFASLDSQFMGIQVQTQMQLIFSNINIKKKILTKWKLEVTQYFSLEITSARDNPFFRFLLYF